MCHIRELLNLVILKMTLFSSNGILMDIFTEIQRLIDEQGSSKVLKERILFLKEKHAAFVTENIAHKTKIAELEMQVRQLKNEVTKLQQISANLKLGISQLIDKISSVINSSPKNDVCAYCGSSRLKETGNKPNKRFGDFGVKDAIFQCEDCGEKTVVMIFPLK